MTMPSNSMRKVIFGPIVLLYVDTPVTKIEKIDDTKYSQGCKTAGNFIHCWWSYKII